jgi:hypothetical protein
MNNILPFPFPFPFPLSSPQPKPSPRERHVAVIHILSKHVEKRALAPIPAEPIDWTLQCR